MGQDVLSPLPIDASLPEVVEALRSSRALVLGAPPGSGKTTRVPPAILRAGLLSAEHPRLVLLQPRRVAARAAASRIASENGWTLGAQVGYQVRFERVAGRDTRLLVETEGILNRRLIADPFLEGIGAVIVDEFHERSIHTDLAIAFLREIRTTVRDDLIVVVMSATLDPGPVARFLGDCPVVTASGHVFPVEVAYRPTVRPAAAVAIVEQVEDALKQSTDSGHILVFLPGTEEIRRARNALAPLAHEHGFEPLALHGSLTAVEQDRVLGPSERRKVILATNIAETSLTIDGVRTVIDSGLARYASYDPARGLDRLELGRISQASADQRAGRAGRTAPGRCIRLWSLGEQRGREPSDAPEIARIDLASAILSLYAWNVSDAARFGWFEPPPPERIEAAQRLLVMLGAVDSDARALTPLGRRLLAVPAHPRTARLLSAASTEGQSRAGAALAAVLTEKDIVMREHQPHSKRPAPGASDLLTRLDLLAEAERARFTPALRDRGIDPVAARQVVRARDEFLRIARRLPGGQHEQSRSLDEESVLRWALLAYPDRVVRRRGKESTGVMVGGRGVRLEPDSVVQNAEFFLALDPRQVRRAGTLEARVRIASAIQVEWLSELFPDSVRSERSVRFDEERQRAVAVTTVSYRDLRLSEDRNGRVDRAEASTALAEALRPRAGTIVRGFDAVAAWLARVEFLRGAIPEAGLSAFDDGALGDVLAEACAGKTRVEEITAGPILDLLSGRLTHPQLRLLNEQAPEALVVPSGNRIRLTYQSERPPVLAVRLQEVFGWRETPRLAQGRASVVLHLLGPNFRVVQVTEDLRSFWSTTYFQVRKDLRARYPRHSWPEDPLTARAEAKGGRRR